MTTGVWNGTVGPNFGHSDIQESLLTQVHRKPRFITVLTRCDRCVRGVCPMTPHTHRFHTNVPCWDPQREVLRNNHLITILKRENKGLVWYLSIVHNKNTRSCDRTTEDILFHVHTHVSCSGVYHLASWTSCYTSGGHSCTWVTWEGRTSLVDQDARLRVWFTPSLFCVSTR